MADAAVFAGLTFPKHNTDTMQCSHDHLTFTLSKQDANTMQCQLNYLSNASFPRFHSLCTALNDLVLCGWIQQRQLKVPVSIVVNHAADVIIYNKLDLEGVLYAANILTGNQSDKKAEK